MRMWWQHRHFDSDDLSFDYDDGNNDDDHSDHSYLDDDANDYDFVYSGKDDYQDKNIDDDYRDENGYAYGDDMTHCKWRAIENPI